MKLKMLAIISYVFCAGCETMKVASVVVRGAATCSHENMETFQFKEFPDGQHYLFRAGKMGASVNVKEGCPTGKFEIYYDTGVFKYKGELDDGGHVVSGEHNKFSTRVDSILVRTMTTADMQNAQLELVDLMNRNRNRFKTKEIISSSATKPKKMPSLSDCIEPESHPMIGNVFKHDGNSLKVFQVLKDKVMVSGGVFKLNFAVLTSKGYVDDELLRPGKYKYVGPYTYETVRKEMRTIRCFKEVD